MFFKLSLLIDSNINLFKDSDEIINEALKKQKEIIKYLEYIILNHNLYIERKHTFVLITKSSKKINHRQLTSFSKRDNKPNSDVLRKKEELKDIIDNILNNKDQKFRIF